VNTDCDVGGRYNINQRSTIISLEALGIDDCSSRSIPPSVDGQCPNDLSVSNYAKFVCVEEDSFQCVEKVDVISTFPAVCPVHETITRRFLRRFYD